MKTVSLFQPSKFLVVLAAIGALVAGIIVFPGFAPIQSAAAVDLEAGGSVSVGTPVEAMPGGNTGGNTGGGLGGGSGGGGTPSVPPPSYYFTRTFYFGGTYYDNQVKTDSIPLRKIFGESKYTYKAIKCAPNGSGASAYAISAQYFGVYSAGQSGEILVSYQCMYPTVESRQPVQLGSITCYYNFSGNYSWSDNKATIAGAGTLLGYRPNLASDPGTPSWNSGGVYGCNTDSNKVWWKTPAKDYGYYRINAAMNYRTFTQWGWPSWMGRGETWWEAGSQGVASFTNWYVYSCSASAYSFEGPMQWWQLPETGQRQFKVSQCPQVTWQCVVDGTPDINTHERNVIVMRDGNNIPTYLPGIGLAGSGIRDTSGAPGVADNNIRYKVGVSPGSTPWNGTDVNGGKQYFKLFNANGSSFQFDKWYSNPNANRNKNIQFYWASTSENQPFKLTWDAQFTAQFYVPRATDVGGGVVYQWITDTANCPNTPVEGNKAHVVRSTGDGPPLTFDAY